MNYRQWKKNYKKRYGVNPPITVDKRKQGKLALKAIRTIGNINWNEIANNAVKAISDAFAIFSEQVASVFEMVGTAFRDMAVSVRQNIQDKESE